MKEENDITQEDQNYLYISKHPHSRSQKCPAMARVKTFPDNYSTKVVAILEKGTIVYLLNSTFGLLCGSVQYAGSRLEGIFTALQNSAVYAQASLNLNLNKRGSHCQYCCMHTLGSNVKFTLVSVLSLVEKLFRTILFCRDCFIIILTKSTLCLRKYKSDEKHTKLRKSYTILTKVD